VKNVSYLRVSTDAQDTAKNKAAVLDFANTRGFGQVRFVEEKVSGKKPWRERKIKSVLDQLEEGDRLIVPELSRLGRSTLEVLEILKVAKDKGVDVYAVKEGLALNGDGMTAKIMTTMLALFAELERDFISQRTREALKARQAAGVKLGRPRGPGKSKLDPHREEIVALLKNGTTKRFVAKRYDTTPVNLYNWLRKNEIDASPNP
jgi:DNA invertase Pin-like site-specific DNA recombinase